jgi:hypothetical protein
MSDKTVSEGRLTDKGDWVAWQQGGELKIGQAEYFTRSVSGRITVCTHNGSVSEDSILEWRRRSISPKSRY